MTKYLRLNYSVFNLGYHLVFTTKYRKPYLQHYEHDLKHIFSTVATKLNFAIYEINIMPDHVHIFFKCHNTRYSITNIVQYLKGYSSRTIRLKYSSLRSFNAFLSPSYFIESIGNMFEGVIRNYIKKSKN